MKRQLLTILLSAGAFWAMAQCPTCIEDTACLTGGTIGICQQSMPDGQVGVPYDEDISFAMPSPVTDPGTGITVDLDLIEITGASGVPFGLNWSCNQPAGVLCEYRPSSGDELGCIKFCGTPVAPGLYNVTVFIRATVTAPVVGQVTQNEDYQFTIRILPSPGGASSFTYTPTEGCGNTSIDFTHNFPSNGAQGFSYFWDMGNGNQYTSENPPTQTYAPGRYRVIAKTVIDTVGYNLEKITLLGTNCNDCVPICLGLPAEGPDMDIKLYPNPNQNGAPIYTDYYQDIVQFPLSIPMNTSGIGPLQNTLYSIKLTDIDPWPLPDCDGGSVVFLGHQAGVQQLTGSNGTDVEVEISHPVIEFNDTIYIDIHPIPAAPTVSYATDTICDRDTVLLKASPFAFYQWYRDTSQVPGGEDSILAVTGTGNYWVVGTDTNFCSAASDTSFINVLPSPPLIVSVVEANGQLVIANLPPGFSAEWYFEGAIIPGETGQFLTPEQEGAYKARIFFGPCENSSAEITVDWSSSGIVTEPEWSLFPNPNDGQFSIEFENGMVVDAVSVFNAEGALIKSIIPEPGQIGVDLDLKGLSGGMYLIGLEVEGELLTKKMIIQSY